MSILYTHTHTCICIYPIREYNTHMTTQTHPNRNIIIPRASAARQKTGDEGRRLRVRCMRETRIGPENRNRRDGDSERERENKKGKTFLKTVGCIFGKQPVGRSGPEETKR